MVAPRLQKLKRKKKVKNSSQGSATYRQQTNGSGGPHDPTSHIEALQKYLRRVGAVQRNFKSYDVRTEGESGYSITQASIKIDPKGEIKVANVRLDKDELAAIEPTDAEREAIRKGFVGVEFPKSIGASHGQMETLRARLGVEPDNWFIMLDTSRRNIVMCQQRTDNDYLPWTMFNDAQWRCMEPGDKLPLWKPEVDRRRARLMIHEGAKAACAVDRMLHSNDPSEVEKRANHPWAAELATCEHWGWIGGAYRPEATDWSEVLSGRWKEIIIVADNDTPGKAAVKAISKALRRANCQVYFLRFNQDFPESFDLADDWPTRDKWWHGEAHKRYRGPSMGAYLQPATWATKRIPRIGKGPPAYEITPQFVEQWVLALTPAPGVYIHPRRPRHLYTHQTFNAIVSQFSDVDDTARLFAKTGQHVHRVEYLPSEPPGKILMMPSGEEVINTFVPSNIKPLEGDASPFVEYMTYMVPHERDRHELMKWCATLIARPDIRMIYGVLLISEKQGIGKGTLGEAILCPLIGHDNCSFPNGAALKNEHNAWVARKRLAVAHEIYAGQSRDMYDKLKTVITDTEQHINEKYIGQYDITSFVHIFACSNSLRALHLDDDDRR
jgi:hypothetical protein